MLTKKQETFIKEYIIHRNAAKAARNAGFSARNARSTAYKLLQLPTIQDAITQEYDRIAKEYKFREAEVYQNTNKLFNNPEIDNTNKVRLLEFMAKCLGMTKEQTTNVSIYQNLDKDKLNKARAALKKRNL